jgi:hypothetical protein
MAPILGKIVLASVAGPRFTSVCAPDVMQEDYGPPKAISLSTREATAEVLLHR